MTILTTDPDFVRAETGSWQQQMKVAVRTVSELLERLNLPANQGRGQIKSVKAVEQFPVFVPLPFLRRIEPGNPADPLLRQVLPVVAEDIVSPGYQADPLGESEATLTPGLLQKYDGRVLLVTTGACAVNCRYCFRRHFPYQESPSSTTQWQPALDQIANDPTLQEVILSGGDPLTLVDERLEKLIERLDDVEQLRRLRIHTRLPIMIPQRITDRLLEMLSGTRLKTVMVIHSNHANEIDADVQSSLANIRNAGILLLNQSVLLRGVNDHAATLADLSNRLLDCGVLPYYLHKNDPVSGTSHFEVTVERAVEIIEQLRAQLPGYAVPRLVQEIAGQPNKTVLA